MMPLTPRTRRQFLSENALGMGSVALACLLGQEKLLAAPHMPRDKPLFDLSPKPSQAPPRARAMISLFMHGGPSHVDLLDPKPELTKRNGTDFPGEVDDVAVIRSMHTDINGHEPSIWFMNTGKAQPGRPALGSWLTYGLGSESQDLPSYVVLTDPGGHPVDGVRNWSNGWLPPLFQGTVVRPQEPRILNLDPPAHLRGQRQAENLALLADLNRRHLERHPLENDLEARIASYELAARMQTAAKEALDISGESEATRKLYGIDEDATSEYGTRCLIARRLVEQGVRFVQVFLSGQPWDTHSRNAESLKGLCARTDQPSAALVMDLKQRGLLDDTIVIWTGEFGRLPISQGSDGRDHNRHAFSLWIAGGGFRPGYVHGATDEWGYKSVENVVNVQDLHATLLAALGLDHIRLTQPYDGRETSLTDAEVTHAKAVPELFR
jgi:uncharacterized protein (DUF1501 family)